MNSIKDSLDEVVAWWYTLTVGYTSRKKHATPCTLSSQNQIPQEHHFLFVSPCLFSTPLTGWHCIPKVYILLLHMGSHCLRSSPGTCKDSVTLKTAGYRGNTVGVWPSELGSLWSACPHLVAWHPVNKVSRGCPRQTHYLLKLVNILDAWSRALLDTQHKK
jgi:hypothetical protein